MRRRGQQHQVDAGVEHLLVGVEADEPPFGRDVDVRREVVVLRQVLQAEFDPLGEQVADRHELLRALRASRASRQAPVPRLPQPIRPMRITSLPAAWALRARSRPAASDPATAGTATCLRNPRRDDRSTSWTGHLLSHVTGFPWILTRWPSRCRTDGRTRRLRRAGRCNGRRCRRSRRRCGLMPWNVSRKARSTGSLRSQRRPAARILNARQVAVRLRTAWNMRGGSSSR